MFSPGFQSGAVHLPSFTWELKETPRPGWFWGENTPDWVFQQLFTQVGRKCPKGWQQSPVPLSLCFPATLLQHQELRSHSGLQDK